MTAWDGASGLRLPDNTFDRDSSIAVLLDGSSAELVDNTWSSPGTDLWQQRCGGVVRLDAGSDWSADWAICPDGNVLTAYDIEFTTLYMPVAETEP